MGCTLASCTAKNRPSHTNSITNCTTNIYFRINKNSQITRYKFKRRICLLAVVKLCYTRKSSLTNKIGVLPLKQSYTSQPPQHIALSVRDSCRTTPKHKIQP